jgi:hypothetical protein
MNATVISASISELPKALQFGKQIGTQRNSGTKFTQQQLFELESAFHKEAGQARVDETLLAKLQAEHAIGREDAQDWFLRRSRHAKVSAYLPGKPHLLHQAQGDSSMMLTFMGPVQTTTMIRT